MPHQNRKEHEVLGEWSWGKVKPKVRTQDEYTKLLETVWANMNIGIKLIGVRMNTLGNRYVPTDTRENWNEWLTQYQLVKDKEPIRHMVPT